MMKTATLNRQRALPLRFDHTHVNLFKCFRVASLVFLFATATKPVENVFQFHFRR